MNERLFALLFVVVTTTETSRAEEPMGRELGPALVRENVWTRARTGRVARDLLRALERDASGVADDRDHVAIRLATVESARGVLPSDPRAVILLVRHRLELEALGGASGSKSTEKSLEEALDRALAHPLPTSLRVLGELDRARLESKRGDDRVAERRLDGVRPRVFDEEVRIEIDACLGLLRLRRGALELARVDFERVVAASPSRLVRGAAQIWLGRAFVEGGRSEEATLALRAGVAWLREAANVSGRSPLAGYPVNPREFAEFERLLELGSVLDAEGFGDDAVTLDLVARVRARAVPVASTPPTRFERRWLEYQGAVLEDVEARLRARNPELDAEPHETP